MAPSARVSLLVLLLLGVSSVGPALASGRLEKTHREARQEGEGSDNDDEDDEPDHNIEQDTWLSPQAARLERAKEAELRKEVRAAKLEVGEGLEKEDIIRHQLQESEEDREDLKEQLDTKVTNLTETLEATQRQDAEEEAATEKSAERLQANFQAVSTREAALRTQTARLGAEVQKVGTELEAEKGETTKLREEVKQLKAEAKERKRAAAAEFASKNAELEDERTKRDRAYAELGKLRHQLDEDASQLASDADDKKTADAVAQTALTNMSMGFQAETSKMNRDFEAALKQRDADVAQRDSDLTQREAELKEAEKRADSQEAELVKFRAAAEKSQNATEGLQYQLTQCTSGAQSVQERYDALDKEFERLVTGHCRNEERRLAEAENEMGKARRALAAEKVDGGKWREQNAGYKVTCAKVKSTLSAILAKDGASAEDAMGDRVRNAFMKLRREVQERQEFEAMRLPNAVKDDEAAETENGAEEKVPAAVPRPSEGEAQDTSFSAALRRDLREAKKHQEEEVEEARKEVNDADDATPAGSVDDGKMTALNAALDENSEEDQDDDQDTDDQADEDQDEESRRPTSRRPRASGFLHRSSRVQRAAPPPEDEDE